MERVEHEKKMADIKQLENNLEIIDQVAKKADEPVNIDDIVEGIFGFLPPDSGSDAPPPTAFSVIYQILITYNFIVMNMTIKYYNKIIMILLSSP